MKATSTILKRVVYSTAIMLGLTFSQVSAQDNSESQIIAVSKDGTALVAPTSLQVAVFPLDKSPLKLQVALENKNRGYVKIRLKDTKGNLVHRPVIITDNKGVINFNLAPLKEGSYLVEVSNNNEVHRYHFQLGSKVVRSVEVKPGLLARSKR